MGQMLNTPACPLKGPADMGRVAGCCARRQAWAQHLTSFRTSPQALRRGGRGGTGGKDRWKQHTYISEVIQEDETKVSPPGLFLWLTGFLEAGCLIPENVAGVLWGGAPGRGGEEVPLRKAQDEQKEDRWQDFWGQCPATTHRALGPILR